MKSKYFKIALVIILLTESFSAAWAQEEKNSIFSIAPAVTFSWYPYAAFKEETSTKTEVDLNNFGLSVMMSLKLFDKVGAHLNLKIDDPTFQKLVDIAGYVTAYYFLVKFDYHSFGGKVTWTGNTPNPIPDGEYTFRNQWTNVSLMFRLDQLKLKLRDSPSQFEFFLYSLLYEMMLVGRGNLGAIGIGYANFDMPLEYRVHSGSGLTNPGFGLTKGEAWGFTMLWDTLIWNMERSASYRIPFLQYVWVYLDWFHGIPSFANVGKIETDAQAIEWMSSANGVSVDGNINEGMRYAIVKMIFGLQYVWDIGKKGRIGLAVGVELLEETIEASNNDIDIYFWSRHIGPAVRVSARW